MEDKAILKQIYAKAVRKQQENISHTPESTEKSSRPKISAPRQMAQQPKVQQPKAQIPATPQIETQMMKSIPENTPKNTSKEGSPPKRITDTPDKAPESSSEREKLIHDLMGVYREKRHMIDELPEKQRKLLEKIGHAMLGTSQSKQPPKSH